MRTYTCAHTHTQDKEIRHEGHGKLQKRRNETTDRWKHLDRAEQEWTDKQARHQLEADLANKDHGINIDHRVNNNFANYSYFLTSTGWTINFANISDFWTVSGAPTAEQ